LSDISAESATRALDPFGFFINHASCIRPLGGTERGPDPSYAFHTAYMEYRPGPVVLTLRFEQLAASFGELVVHVNSFLPGGGSHALLVTLHRVAATELAETGADVVLRFNAMADVGYAVFGYFPAGTDATAASLTIHAEEQGTIGETVPGEARQPTVYGGVDLGHPARLVTDEPVSFGLPVSQIMTTSQLDEDSYLACARSLSLTDPTTDAGWKRAFVHQALDRYGFLAPGAHGLSLGDGESPLAAASVARGCSITIALHVVDAGSATAFAARRYPALCPDARFDTRCAIRGFDPNSFDVEMCGHDFLWSLDLACNSDAVATPQDFITRSLAYLRPRGLAVHLFDVALEDEAIGQAAISRLRLEALALKLISRGHDVGQLNFGDGAFMRRRDGEPVRRVVPFGLIVRRGLT